jgi:hypothetical protein
MSRLERARARRRERGAALTEAAVVIPVFLILFASLVFVHKLYSVKGATRNQARHAMWAYALNACEDGKYTSKLASKADSGDQPTLDAMKNDGNLPKGTGNLPPEGEKLLNQANSDPGTDLEVGDEWGVSRTVVSAQPVMGTGPLGKMSSDKIVTKMEVQCDEKARGASPADVLAFLWKLPETLNLAN